MRSAIVVAAGAFILAGCITSRPVTLPNGAEGLAINCPGTARDIADCMNRAGKECGGPYRILTREGGTVTAVAMPIGQNIFFASGTKRTMIVQCGAEQSPGN